MSLSNPIVEILYSLKLAAWLKPIRSTLRARTLPNSASMTGWSCCSSVSASSATTAAISPACARRNCASGPISPISTAVPGVASPGRRFEPRDWRLIPCRRQSHGRRCDRGGQDDPCLCPRQPGLPAEPLCRLSPGPGPGALAGCRTGRHQLHPADARLTTVDLLILDDWGLQNFSPQGRRDILELIEPRSARRSTMIVSQLPVTAWHNVLGESTIADAILDRIVHYGHHITLTGESRRKLLKPPPIDDPRPTH